MVLSLRASEMADDFKENELDALEVAIKELKATVELSVSRMTSKMNHMELVSSSRLDRLEAAILAMLPDDYKIVTSIESAKSLFPEPTNAVSHSLEMQLEKEIDQVNQEGPVFSTEDENQTHGSLLLHHGSHPRSISVISSMSCVVSAAELSKDTSHTSCLNGPQRLTGELNYVVSSLFSLEIPRSAYLSYFLDFWSLLTQRDYDYWPIRLAFDPGQFKTNGCLTFVAEILNLFPISIHYCISPALSNLVFDPGGHCEHFAQLVNDKFVNVVHFNTIIVEELASVLGLNPLIPAPGILVNQIQNIDGFDTEADIGQALKWRGMMEVFIHTMSHLDNKGELFEGKILLKVIGGGEFYNNFCFTYYSDLMTDTHVFCWEYCFRDSSASISKIFDICPSLSTLSSIFMRIFDPADTQAWKLIGDPTGNGYLKFVNAIYHILAILYHILEAASLLLFTAHMTPVNFLQLCMDFGKKNCRSNLSMTWVALVLCHAVLTNLDLDNGGGIVIYGLNYIIVWDHEEAKNGSEEMIIGREIIMSFMSISLLGFQFENVFLHHYLPSFSEEHQHYGDSIVKSCPIYKTPYLPWDDEPCFISILQPICELCIIFGFYNLWDYYIETVAIMMSPNLIPILATRSEEQYHTVPNIFMTNVVLDITIVQDDVTASSQNRVFWVAYIFLSWNGLDPPIEKILVWFMIAFCLQNWPVRLGHSTTATLILINLLVAYNLPTAATLEDYHVAAEVTISNGIIFYVCFQPLFMLLTLRTRSISWGRQCHDPEMHRPNKNNWAKSL